MLFCGFPNGCWIVGWDLTYYGRNQNSRLRVTKWQFTMWSCWDGIDHLGGFCSDFEFHKHEKRSLLEGTSSRCLEGEVPHPLQIKPSNLMILGYLQQYPNGRASKLRTSPTKICPKKVSCLEETTGSLEVRTLTFTCCHVDHAAQSPHFLRGFWGDFLIPLLVCKGSAHRWSHYETMVEVAAQTRTLGINFLKDLDLPSRNEHGNWKVHLS